MKLVNREEQLLLQKFLYITEKYSQNEHNNKINKIRQSNKIKRKFVLNKKNKITADDSSNHCKSGNEQSNFCSRNLFISDEIDKKIKDSCGNHTC